MHYILTVKTTVIL